VQVEEGPLASESIRLQVEHFSLTANNITYAQFGDMLDYWNFFPVDAEWGKVPAMGWAVITASNVDGLEVGGRYYGWFPMANSVDITATKSGSGLRDDGAHRSKHAGAYRSFVRTDLDGMYTSFEDEHRHSLLRGLYITGFLIDQFFTNQAYLGVQQAIVMSASSKTALGYAACARSHESVNLVGITSASNRAFVESTGLYSQVISYDELDSIAQVPSVIVDMAGAGEVVAAIHGRLGDHIAHSMVVGKSHHDARPALVPAGPQPAMFFAPTAMDSCLAEWGSEEYARRTKSGLEAFIESSRHWLVIETHHGPEAAQAAWKALHSGTIDPSVGLIASLQ
jgi:hypothetical protein